MASRGRFCCADIGRLTGVMAPVPFGTHGEGSLHVTIAEDVHDVIVMTGTGVLGTWVADFIRQAYSASERPAEVHSGDGDDVLADLGRTHGESRAEIVTAPGRVVMDLIESREMPVAAVLDDPVDSVRYAMAVLSLDVMTALRHQARAACGHHLLCDNPAVLLIERGSVKPARVLLSTLLAHLKLRVRADAEAALVAHFAGPEDENLSLEEALGRRVDHYVRLEQVKDVVDAADAAVVRQVLSPLVHGAISPDIGPIAWPTRTFMLGDKPNEPAPPVADITGGARVIYYGPYFYLPPGEWRVRLVLAFSAETKGVPFSLVLFAKDKPIAKVTFRPQEGGAFEGTFLTRHVNPEHFLEIQLMTNEGTIDGHVALGQLVFTRDARISAIDHRDV